MFPLFDRHPNHSDECLLWGEKQAFCGHRDMYRLCPKRTSARQNVCFGPMSASSPQGHFDRLRKCPLSERMQTWRLTASCHFCFSSFALRSSISRNKLPMGLLGSLRRIGPHFFSNLRLASASGPVPYIKRSSSSKSFLGSFLIGLSFWSPGTYVGLLSCRVLSFPAKNLAAVAQRRGLNKQPSQKKQAHGSTSAFGAKQTWRVRCKMSANDPKWSGASFRGDGLPHITALRFGLKMLCEGHLSVWIGYMRGASLREIQPSSSQIV